MFVVLELLDQLLDLVLACCILLLNCRYKYASYSLNLGVLTDFPHNFSYRLTVPKMILRLGFVDLGDYIRCSILARLVTLSEFGELFFAELLLRLHTYRFLCKLQEVNCGERIHLTVSGKIAGQASNPNKILYLEAFPSILVWLDPWFRKIA